MRKSNRRNGRKIALRMENLDARAPISTLMTGLAAMIPASIQIERESKKSVAEGLSANQIPAPRAILNGKAINPPTNDVGQAISKETAKRGDELARRSTKDEKPDSAGMTSATPMPATSLLDDGFSDQSRIHPANIRPLALPAADKASIETGRADNPNGRGGSDGIRPLQLVESRSRSAAGLQTTSVDANATNAFVPAASPGTTNIHEYNDSPTNHAAVVSPAINSDASGLAPTLAYTSGNGNQGSATPSTSTPFIDLIGDYVTVKATAYGGRTIASATWTVSGGTLGSQSVTARGGIINTPLNTSSSSQISPDKTYATLNFYWNQNPGAGKVAVSLQYYPQTTSGGSSVNSGGNSVSGYVYKPAGGIDTFAAGTPGVASNPNGNPILTTSTGFYTTQTPGIQYNAWVDPATLKDFSGGGTYAIFQVADPYIAGWTTASGSIYRAGVYAPTTTPPTTPTQPRPLIDAGDPIKYEYPFTGADLNVYRELYIPPHYTGSVSSVTRTFDDTPFIGLDDDERGNQYTYIATFTDYLMFNAGGAWVPLGSASWSIMMASYFTTTWAYTYTPTSHTAYAATSSFPSWNDSLAYLQATYAFQKVN